MAPQAHEAAAPPPNVPRELNLHQAGYDGELCRGMMVNVHADGKSSWRPFPWNHVPDRAAAIFSATVLLLVLPGMATLIGTAVVAWEVLRRLFNPLNGPYFLAKIRAGQQWIADRTMRDPRNAPYVGWMLWTATVTPAFFYLAYRRHAQYGFEPWLFVAYNLVRIGPRFRFFAHVHVLVHKEGHDKKGFFHGPFRVLNWLNQWFIGPFYGQVPMSYETGHVKIHHRYDNGLDDLHTNLDLDRSEPYSLLVYFPRFLYYWSGVGCAIVFTQRKEWKLAAKMWAGVIGFFGFMGYLVSLNWSFALGYFIYPFAEATIFFALIGYLWHAWMDPEEPSNVYVNSVTILDGHDNIWNEDYHVVHHSSQCHWTEYVAHYERNKDEYAKHKATIFQDCEEGMMIGWLLTKNWDELAKHFVDLNGKMTHEEKKEVILSRLRPTLSGVAATKPKSKQS